MKIYLVLSFIVVSAAIGCAKRNEGGDLMLSKMYRNNLLEVEYLYDSDGKPYRRNSYYTAQGVSDFTGFRLYYYTGNLLTAVDDFDDKNQLFQKVSLAYDAQGKLTRLDDKDKNDNLQSYYLFENNPGGDVKKCTIKSGATNKTLSEISFSYNAEGYLTKILRYSFPGMASVLFDSTLFQIKTRYPSNWNYYEMNWLLGLYTTDRTFADMVIDSSYTYRPDAPPQITQYKNQSKSYNNGYISSQSSSFKTQSVVNASAVYQLRYEYISK